VTAGTILLSGAPAQIIFTYDFSGVVSSYSVTIDGTLAGTFTIDGQVYDAATYFATPTYNKNILTLTLDLSKISLNTTGGDFSFNLFLADSDNSVIECLIDCDNKYQQCIDNCQSTSSTSQLNQCNINCDKSFKTCKKNC